VACVVVIVIHLIYLFPMRMLMGVLVKFIYQSDAMHAVNVGCQDIGKSAFKKRAVS